MQVRAVSHRFGTRRVLCGVSMDVRAGEIRALLGPNGAGKTTLLRILSGLITPTEGEVRVAGLQVHGAGRHARRLIGLVPGGDRSFYLRLSGLENLIFFARLQGLSARKARTQAREYLSRVGLAEAERMPVGQYSHGMQKKLAVARALLADPPVLLLDEATHDLDPEAARAVRALVSDAAHRGAAVVWATQRVDEIRGFASTVTLLHRGEVRFAGTVPELLAQAAPERYIVRIPNGRLPGSRLERALQQAVGHRGTIARADDRAEEDFILAVAPGAVLGDVLAGLAAARFEVLSCREERLGVEEAFLLLTGDAGPEGAS